MPSTVFVVLGVASAAAVQNGTTTAKWDDAARRATAASVQNGTTMARRDDAAHRELSKSKPASTPVSPKIVNGDEVPAGTYPWYAELEMDGYLCGGSLIDANWVLTAAHCITDRLQSNPSRGWGYANSVNVGTGVQFFFKSVVKHPNYNPNTFNLDFALLELTTPVTGIAPVTLTDDASKYADDTDATVMGFGALKEGGHLSRKLMAVDVKIDAGCGKYSPSSITSNMLCAGDINNAGEVEDSCQGDSGGPLVWTNSGSDTGNAMLVGVVSWGQGCARKGYPGVYARVDGASVKSWLLQTTGKDFFAGGPEPSPSPSPSPTPTPACKGNPSTFDATWGGCQTYQKGHPKANHEFCDEDKDFRQKENGKPLTASQVCEQCEKCVNSGPAPSPSPSPAPECKGKCKKWCTKASNQRPWTQKCKKKRCKGCTECCELIPA